MTPRFNSDFKEPTMNDQPSELFVSSTGDGARRVYTAPQLVIHGTIQTLTLDTGGTDGTSSVDTD
jgi:hypothetical protein